MLADFLHVLYVITHLNFYWNHFIRALRYHISSQGAFLSKSLSSEIGTVRIWFHLPSPALRWWRWVCMCATRDCSAKGRSRAVPACPSQC